MSGGEDVIAVVAVEVGGARDQSWFCVTWGQFSTFLIYGFAHTMSTTGGIRLLYNTNLSLYLACIGLRIPAMGYEEEKEK